MTGSTPAWTTLRLQPDPTVSGLTGRRIVVTDTTWTPGPGDPAIALREVASRVLAEHDFIAETSALLDEWAETSRVADLTTVDGTAYWYRNRLKAWLWLQELIAWLAIVDALVAEARPTAIEVAGGVTAPLADASRQIAARDGLAFRAERTTGVAAGDAVTGDSPEVVETAGATGDGPATPRARRSLFGRLVARLRPDEPTRRAGQMRRRLKFLGGERPRLLVLLAHAPQRVETPDGPRMVNAYLGPVVDRLAGTALEPIEVDERASSLDDADWARFDTHARRLPGDVLRLFIRAEDATIPRQQADTVVAALRALAVPVVASGVDVGPALAMRVADDASRSLRSQIRTSVRVERLMRELRPAGLLLADEYHRQAWVGAAARAGVPTAAIQHGLVYERHTGYMHRTRPEGLRLPTRTYTFGRWERDLLRDRSVYRPDEVEVGGSPRLTLAASPAAVDRDAVRAEMGVAAGDRLVLVSGTWGTFYRMFHYPIALAGILDRPLPRVHLVVKLHPAEQDEGPYRAILERAAAARGFAPPPVTVVQNVDLYRLLAASDAHLGIHSTVLTEAVVAGTLNLLASMLAGHDLLGYLPAGVAVPVRDGGDLLDALDRRRDLLPDAATRQAFLDAHFEPGNAAERIADDLVRWLA